jgi:LysM repeat protein
MTEDNLFGELLNDDELSEVTGGTKAYTVRKGDTLNKIASRFHVTKSQLMRWNRTITDTDYVQPGWVIRVG